MPANRSRKPRPSARPWREGGAALKLSSSGSATPRARESTRSLWTSSRSRSRRLDRTCCVQVMRIAQKTMKPPPNRAQKNSSRIVARSSSHRWVCHRSAIRRDTRSGGCRNLKRRLRGRPGSPARGDLLAIVELHQPVRQIEVPVVMADDQNRLAPRPQLGEQCAIEDFAEFGVLVGRPFVEDVDRTVLQVGREQSEPLALSLRQIGRRKDAVGDLDLVIELQADQVLLHLAIEVPGDRAQTEQRLEEVEVRKHGREVLAVRL